MENIKEPRIITSRESALDGNSAAGLLHDVFGAEMTTSKAKCGSCGTVSRIGELMAFGGAIGSVLRCPKCEDVMMRISSRDGSLWLDMQGIAYLKREQAET